MTTTKTSRVASIDAIRAITMMLMLFVNDIPSLKGVPHWLFHAAADEDKGSNTIKGIFLRGKFEGVEEHRTPLAFDICWELFPEDKEEFYQLPDGTWTVKED